MGVQGCHPSYTNRPKVTEKGTGSLECRQDQVLKVKNLWEIFRLKMKMPLYPTNLNFITSYSLHDPLKCNLVESYY